jgi:hypothetical protein
VARGTDLGSVELGGGVRMGRGHEGAEGAGESPGNP